MITDDWYIKLCNKKRHCAQCLRKFLYVNTITRFKRYLLSWFFQKSFTFLAKYFRLLVLHVLCMTFSFVLWGLHMYCFVKLVEHLKRYIHQRFMICLLTHIDKNKFQKMKILVWYGIIFIVQHLQGQEKYKG